MEGKIYEAINAIMQEVGYVQKQKGANLNYTFASETALIQALRPVMIKHGVVAHVLLHNNLTREEYATKSGTRMTNSVIEGVVRFAHTDGSYIDVSASGEGSDSGDKSVNKAQTGLLKYALRQTFLIETGDDPDKDPSEERTTTTTVTSLTKAVAKPVAAVTKPAKTWDAFLTMANDKFKLDPTQVQAALKKAGYNGFDPKNWNALEATLQQAVPF